MKKKILIIIITVLTLAAAVSAGFFAHSFAAVREAKTAFKSELEALIEENKELEKKKNELKSSVSETEQSIESKNEISSEAEEYTEQLQKLRQELEAANKTLTELDESIEKKNEYIEQVDSIKEPVKGRSFEISENTLDCPDDIAEGRYIATGSGNLLIYNDSNKLRISENLSTIDTNSFTFDIAEGESVKATDSITLTTLK